MLLRSLFFLLLFAITLAAQTPPIVDGNCSDFPANSRKEKIADGVDLLIHQDKHFVWLCYGYSDGSFATTDIKLKSKAFPNGLNLHVSAQLGEWPVDKPELSPKTAESELWWSFSGWTANTVWINGMDRSGTTPRYKFKNAKAREIQIGKQRFGRGDWRFSMEVRAIRSPDGKNFDATFPVSGEYLLKVT